MFLAVALLPTSVDAFCGCRVPRAPRCADATTKHRLRFTIDLAVQDGTVELITQSGPFHAPVAEFDGKQVLAIFLPRGEVFQGYLQDALTVTLGAMQGPTVDVTTEAVFPPGEYEMLLFVDLAAGGGLAPQRGDIAAFDNTICDPTGVSIRFAVGCEDATVTLTNRHFIIF
jgi:hypothetical protein